MHDSLIILFLCAGVKNEIHLSTSREKVGKVNNLEVEISLGTFGEDPDADVILVDFDPKLDLFRPLLEEEVKPIYISQIVT